jgi:hypothetical protein
MTGRLVFRAVAIYSLEKRRAVFVARGPLWSDYVRDCDLMLARLRAGLDLTPYQRGIIT